MSDAQDQVDALLDAFAALNERNADLTFHENREFPGLARAVASWCERQKKRIEHYVTTSNHRTYEVRKINVGDAEVCVFPLKIGTLDGRDELRDRIEAIRKEADERINGLIEVEIGKAKAVRS